jgi:DNA-binding NarL/FixJ family response regulator
VRAEAVTLAAPAGGSADSILLMLLDQHPSNKEGMVSLIRAQPGYRIVAASAKIEEAVRGVQEAQPDVVLLNLRPGNGCLALAGALHGAVPVSRVIIIGVEPDDEFIPDLVRARVSAFVMAEASFEQLLHTIYAVALGIQVLPPALTRSLFRYLNPHGFRQPPRHALDVRRLTGREQQVAALIVRGVSNRQISVQLRITLHTAKVHVHRILSKLGMSSRLEVATFFQEAQSLAAAGLPGTALSPPLDLVPIPVA